MTEDQFWKAWDLVGKYHRRCRVFIRGFNAPIEGWIDHIRVGRDLFVQVVPYMNSPDENLFVPVEDVVAVQSWIPEGRDNFEPRGFLARLASMRTPQDDVAAGYIGSDTDIDAYIEDLGAGRRFPNRCFNDAKALWKLISEAREALRQERPSDYAPWWQFPWSEGVVDRSPPQPST
jgi:hypothetical protein